MSEGCRFAAFVKAITPEAMILSDSTGMKKIARSHCTVDTENREMYTLWPALIYLLSVVGEKD